MAGPVAKARYGASAIGAATVLAVIACGMVNGASDDPTRPPPILGQPASPGAVDNPATKLQLQSVLISSGRSVALIGGVAYRVGDTVADKKVVAIGPNWVRLRDSDGEHLLRLIEGIEKRPPATQKKGAAS